MIPRGTPDIGWRDLAIAACDSIRPANCRAAQEQVEAAWSPAGDALVCLSVRSGFDLLLSVLAWPAGSEVIVSAVTIPDMLSLLHAHGLIAVAVDVDFRTLEVDPQEIAARIGPNTKAILIAHLFGSRMPLNEVVAVAKRHQLLVLEDCAQAYDCSGFRGHPDADVTMFSFGPIKTRTALGGALLRVNQAELLQQMRLRQRSYPHQSRWKFLRRVLLFGGLKALSQPWLFGLFARACRLLGQDGDAIIARQTRGFRRADLQRQLRQQPCAALLRLLLRRLRTVEASSVERRKQLANAIAANLSRQLPGRCATHHSHWALPVASDTPDRLREALVENGFDATRKASSLVAASSEEEAHWIDRLVYLPLHPALTERDIARMCAVIDRAN